jgi:NAD(P)-dependent dehydrogenase (short-subunit alcohol dehydrogenase family)
VTRVLLSSYEAITRTFQVNTLSHFWMAKAFLPDMIDRNHGHIVTICSASAFCGVCATPEPRLYPSTPLLLLLDAPRWACVCTRPRTECGQPPHFATAVVLRPFVEAPVEMWCLSPTPW